LFDRAKHLLVEAIAAMFDGVPSLHLRPAQQAT
jgi:hypothetical protein